MGWATRGRDIADAAYIASRAATYEDCKRTLVMFGMMVGSGKGKAQMSWGNGYIMQRCDMITRFRYVLN